MANELAIHLTTGLTLYAQRLNSGNLVWNGSSYVVPVDADWADYVVTLTESGATGWYYGTDPDPGTLGGYAVFRQAGGSPATTDVAVGAGALGTNVTHAAGTAWASGAITAASLASGCITDAKISTPAEATGNPTTVLAMIRRLHEWVRNKRTRNRTTGLVTLRNAADDGDLVTYTQSTASVTDTEGASS